jgi:hypothetical protein
MAGSLFTNLLLENSANASDVGITHWNPVHLPVADLKRYW